MSLIPSLPKDSCSEQALPLSSKENRAHDAERIRQDFVTSRRQLPQPLRKNLSAEEDGPVWESYLKSMGREQLHDLLNRVLSEVRRRESEQIKQNILRHSQQLRLKNVS